MKNFISPWCETKLKCHNMLLTICRQMETVPQILAASSRGWSRWLTNNSYRPSAPGPSRQALFVLVNIGFPTLPDLSPLRLTPVLPPILLLELCISMKRFEKNLFHNQGRKHSACWGRSPCETGKRAACSLQSYFAIIHSPDPVTYKSVFSTRKNWDQ